MAKEQNLSLNPTKISGVCGRLMCCLKYEEDTYEQIRKSMPRIGREVMTPDGPGTVWEQHVIKESLRVRIQKGDSGELRDYPMDQVTPIHPSAKSGEENAAAQEDSVPQERPYPRRDRRREKPEQPAKAPEENVIPENKPEAAKPQDVQPQPKPADAKPAEEPKPQANAWKAALERAMQASKTEEPETIAPAGVPDDVVEE